MPSEKILIVEDEPDIADLLELNLTREGFKVVTARTGEDGLRLALAELPDLVLLDVMLPGIDGLQVCRALRTDTRTAGTPIVMLTARGDEGDIVGGFETGADEYVTKPFSPRVLLARLKAILRRRGEGSPTETSDRIQFDGLIIDRGRHEVVADGEPVILTGTEFGLLLALARRPGMVLSRNQLLDQVQGEMAIVSDRTIDVHIAALRKKLGKAGSRIQTIRGVGYRFVDEAAKS